MKYKRILVDSTIYTLNIQNNAGSSAEVEVTYHIPYEAGTKSLTLPSNGSSSIQGGTIQSVWIKNKNGYSDTFRVQLSDGSYNEAKKINPNATDVFSVEKELTSGLTLTIS